MWARYPGITEERGLECIGLREGSDRLSGGMCRNEGGRHFDSGHFVRYLQLNFLNVSANFSQSGTHHENLRIAHRVSQLNRSRSPVSSFAMGLAQAVIWLKGAVGFVEEKFHRTLTRGWITKFRARHSAYAANATVAPQKFPFLQAPRRYLNGYTPLLHCQSSERSRSVRIALAFSPWSVKKRITAGCSISIRNQYAYV
jgi:hypothetical protein